MALSQASNRLRTGKACLLLGKGTASQPSPRPAIYVAAVAPSARREDVKVAGHRPALHPPICDGAPTALAKGVRDPVTTPAYSARLDHGFITPALARHMSGCGVQQSRRLRLRFLARTDSTDVKTATRDCGLCDYHAYPPSPVRDLVAGTFSPQDRMHHLRADPVSCRSDLPPWGPKAPCPSVVWIWGTRRARPRKRSVSVMTRRRRVQAMKV